MTPNGNGATRYEHAHVTPGGEDLATGSARKSGALPCELTGVNRISSRRAFSLGIWTILAVHLLNTNSETLQMPHARFRDGGP
ncbi:hypothetical protein TRIATDRAFT_308605 [Trichoderma atroviride IMI 206040]|uniref:Uncharacterized protein n=1 Tax=Hypocrea atroviridis (strain ATCC 20476 / IMI 206040) TaxID=452589 RepID=G9NVN8_HYPAI|nr:uncharacterized protein TRIATDRAFT_308605 [Trichoderma atroviride IMI 206040]EHK45057.1 hypothetical protein TRIATDRAFT_308605 [Trichoderma atroviride IMI 206040]